MTFRKNFSKLILCFGKFFLEWKSAFENVHTLWIYCMLTTPQISMNNKLLDKLILWACINYNNWFRLIYIYQSIIINYEMWILFIYNMDRLIIGGLSPILIYIGGSLRLTTCWFFSTILKRKIEQFYVRCLTLWSRKHPSMLFSSLLCFLRIFSYSITSREFNLLWSIITMASFSVPGKYWI